MNEVCFCSCILEGVSQQTARTCSHVLNYTPLSERHKKLLYSLVAWSRILFCLFFGWVLYIFLVINSKLLFLLVFSQPLQCLFFIFVYLILEVIWSVFTF